MIDLVIGGPDMSGTSTQVNDFIEHFKSRGLKVKDIRGTELHALFHCTPFSEGFLNLDEFLASSDASTFLKEAALLLNQGKVASCVKNNVTTFLDPDSADVWILEEPTKRGAGQMNRVIEQQRKEFGSSLHPLSAAYCHQAYRTDEFLRFRKILREKGKIIIRSRSEESACYQVYDEQKLPLGIKLDEYLSLPGHEVAFSNPPTHIFIVCGPKDWQADDYLQLKEQRQGSRQIDDHEANVEYQLLVNFRYSTSWIDMLYDKGCNHYGSQSPQIIRFNIHDAKEVIKNQMMSEIKKIIPPLL